MNDSKLKSAADLNDVLSSSEDLDAETRNQLEKVANDLGNAITDSTPAPEHARTIREQLREMLTDLETRHPHVADIITQVDDILAGIGI